MPPKQRLMLSPKSDKFDKFMQEINIVKSDEKRYKQAVLLPVDVIYISLTFLMPTESLVLLLVCRSFVREYDHACYSGLSPKQDAQRQPRLPLAQVNTVIIKRFNFFQNSINQPRSLIFPPASPSDMGIVHNPSNVQDLDSLLQRAREPQSTESEHAQQPTDNTSASWLPTPDLTCFA